MNILHICHRFLPVIGGLELHVYHISKELIRRGHSVRVFTSNEVGQKQKGAEYEVIDEIDVYRFSPLYLGRAGLQRMLMPSMLRTIAVDKSIEVIHAFSMDSLNSLLSVFANMLGRAPLIFTPFYYPLSMVKAGHFSPQKLYYCLIPFILRFVNKTIACTYHELNQLKALGIRSNDLEMIPCAVDWEKFSRILDGELFRQKYSLRKNVVLSVTRIDHNKGLETLIKAAPIVLKIFPDTSFLIVGQDWGFRSLLENLSKNLDVEDSIVFTGFIPDKELMQAYAAADLFVLCSEAEGFGNVILEAAACEKPVIATQWTGLRDMLRYAKVGLLFDYGNENQLAENIIRLLEDKNQAKEMGRKGRKLVNKRYTYKIIADQMENLYERLTDQKMVK